MLASERSPALAEALGPGSPIVVFDRVSLAFDDKVILRDVSFTLITGHTKIFLGASGAGKSTILKLILGLLKPDSGVIWVNGEQIDRMREERADEGPHRPRHGVPGRRPLRLADRGRERRLQALRGERHAARRSAATRRGSARVRRPQRAHRQDAVGAFRRPAPPGGDRAGDVVQAADPALRRADDRPRPDYREHHRRRDHQAARSRERQLDRRDPPAARRVPHCDLFRRPRRRPHPHRRGRREEGRRSRVHHAARWTASRSKGMPRSSGPRTTRTCRLSCPRGLHATHALARLVGTENRDRLDRRADPRERPDLPSERRGRLLLAAVLDQDRVPEHPGPQGRRPGAGRRASRSAR